MYSEENKSSTLAKFLSIYDYVFVDTCSLMEDGFPSFMDTLSASKEYWKEGLRVIVPGECVAELRKHSRSKDNQEARIEAKRALKILHHDKWHGKTLEIAKSIGENDFADNALYTLVSSLRIQNKILIITQDKTLTTDLKNLNNLDSQHGRYLDVYRIKDDGGLEANPGESADHIRENAGRRYASQNSRGSYERKPRFTRSKDDHRDNTRRFDKPRVRYDDNKPSDVVDKPLTPSFHPEIVSADERLFANIQNPNYPNNKKVADIDAQLSALSALSKADYDKLQLAYTSDELKTLRQKFAGSPYVAASKPAAEEKKPIVSAPSPKIETAKEAPVKVAPKEPIQRSPAPKGWFEFGRDITEGAIKCGTHFGILIRDASVPYIKQVHGPVDLTSDDVKKATSSIHLTKVGETADVSIGEVNIHAEKTERDYKVWLSVGKPVQASKPEPIKEEKPSEIPAKTAVKVEKPAEKPAKKEEPKKVQKPRRSPKSKTVSAESKPETAVPVKEPTKKVIASNDSTTAVPEGASLIVGVPSDENRRSYIERRSRRLDNAELSTAKPTERQKHEEKAHTTRVSHVSSMPAAKPVVKSAAHKPASKKPVSKPAAKPVVAKKPVDFAAIEASDKRLNANLGNPNYPLAARIKDLKAQDALLHSLSEDEKKKLKYNHSLIQQKLTELEKGKK